MEESGGCGAFTRLVVLAAEVLLDDLDALVVDVLVRVRLHKDSSKSRFSVPAILMNLLEGR